MGRHGAFFSAPQGSSLKRPWPTPPSDITFHRETRGLRIGGYFFFGKIDEGNETCPEAGGEAFFSFFIKRRGLTNRG